MSLRVALIGNAMSTMVRFRGPFITTLLERGFEVVAICPNGTDTEEKALSTLGAQHVTVNKMSRQGLAPHSELALLNELTDILRKISPDCVLSYFLKPAIWGSIAAKRAGVPRISAMIEGMGFAFSAPAPTIKGRLIQQATQRAIIQLLKRSSRGVDHLIVLNEDDASLMRKKVKVSDNCLTVLDGIGIDLDHFSVAPASLEPVRFLLAARLIREKGIEMFVECAVRVKKLYPDAKFRLVGGIDSAPGALSETIVSHWARSGIIEWPGYVDDVRPHLRESSVFVLPTLYREGLPRSIMEAMAMARPVITSDMPGAKHSITHGKSGIIHPVGDIDKLVAACLSFCEEPEKIADFGRAAREEAMCRYSLSIQNDRLVKLVVGRQSPPSHDQLMNA